MNALQIVDEKQPASRFDSTWENTLAALGSIRDKSSGIRPRRRPRLTRDQLVTLHDQNAIAYRVVHKLPDDAFATPWKIVADDVDEAALIAFRRYLDDVLELSKQVQLAIAWSRLYGAALLTLPISDGRQPHQPLDLLNVRQFYRPTPVSAPDVLPTMYDSAFGSPTYRQLLEYQVQSLGSHGVHKIHHSRTLLFEPIQLPIEERLRGLGLGHNGLGPSVLEQVYTEIALEGSARQSANAMLYTASILFVKLKGLADTLTAADGKKKVRENLLALREALDALGMLGLDEHDEIGSVDRSFAGAPDLLEKQLDAVGAALPMPREIGLNVSPNGLRGGELSGPRALWNAIVEGFRTAEIIPALVHLIRIASIAYKLPLGDFKVEFDPLWIPDEREQAETASKNADTDRKYIDTGALSVREVRRQRFVLGNRGALSVDEADTENVQDRGMWLGPAVEIAKAVHAGELPRSAGAQLLVAGGFSPMLLGEAGKEPEQAEAEAVALALGPPPNDLIPVEEAGAMLGMKTATITAAIRRGELKVWQVGSRRSVSAAAVHSLASGESQT